MDFLSRPTKFKPIASQCWERQFGNEFNRWEWLIITEFSQAKKAKYTSISGAVISSHKLGRGQFLLTPAPHLPQEPHSLSMRRRAGTAK